jgi:two-component system response regulator DctR
MSVPFGVLVVEDDPFHSVLYRRYFVSFAGFELRGILTRAEDLPGGVDPEIDLVILDLNLPGMGGLEAAARWRRGPDWIVASAENRPEEIREALRLGAFDYLIKPFGVARLRSALGRYAAFRRGLRRAGTGLEQEELDEIRGISGEPSRPEPPKGLHARTLSDVLELLRSHAAPLSAVELGGLAGLSRTASRRYLNYLEKNGRVSLVLEHGRGRPLHRYRMIPFENRRDDDGERRDGDRAPGHEA